MEQNKFFRAFSSALHDSFRSTGPFGGIDRILKEAPDTFAHAQQTVKSIEIGMVSAVREIHKNLAPEEFEIEIALKFTAEGNVVLTKLGGEAQILIHLTYRQSNESNTEGN